MAIHCLLPLFIAFNVSSYCHRQEPNLLCNCLIVLLHYCSFIWSITDTCVPKVIIYVHSRITNAENASKSFPDWALLQTQLGTLQHSIDLLLGKGAELRVPITMSYRNHYSEYVTKP